MNSLYTAGLALAALAAPLAASATTYDIDASHAQITFKVRHLGISKVTGTFDDFAGSFDYDADKPKDSSADITIQAASVSTRNTDRDNHLRSPDFLSIEKYPEITFTTTGVSDVDDSSMKIHGDLTLHGVTKNVVLDAEMTGAANDPMGNSRVAFEATTTIDRRQYGLEWSQALETGGLLVGNDVDITIEVEGVERKEKADGDADAKMEMAEKETADK